MEKELERYINRIKEITIELDKCKNSTGATRILLDSMERNVKEARKILDKIDFGR